MNALNFNAIHLEISTIKKTNKIVKKKSNKHPLRTQILKQIVLVCKLLTRFENNQVLIFYLRKYFYTEKYLLSCKFSQHLYGSVSNSAVSFMGFI